MQKTLKKNYCSVHSTSTKDKSTLYQSPITGRQCNCPCSYSNVCLNPDPPACTSVAQHGILYKRSPDLSDFASVLTAYLLEIFTRAVQYSVQTKSFRLETPGSVLDLNYSPLPGLCACLFLSSRRLA